MAERLLVVDDEVNLLRAVAAMLRAEGYEVTTARSAREALTHVARSVPDLVVSDIRMPGMDGYQLARSLRDSPRTSLVPIVFLTAKGGTEDRVEGFRTGVDAYLTKPFEPEELLAVIRSILNRVERTHAEIARLVGAKDEGEAAFVRDEELTDAEWRVAEAVARGLSNKEIAGRLTLSVRTVEGHLYRAGLKLGVSERTALAEVLGIE